jgi:nitroimidazol reductase NimA-like FMN-containing flavoprotein (pyridoxamine 5'-phosphate oxidase superfamily)
MSAESISYKARICADEKRVVDFLESARVGVVGINAGEIPYAVPVNFIWQNGNVYFHGMGSGKKELLLKDAPPVCFTIYTEYGTVKDEMPCHADTSYFSVMIFGHAQKVTDFDEAAAVLERLVEKFMPGVAKTRVTAPLIEKYRSAKDGNAVSVYRIKPEHLTAKENRAEPNELFLP